MIGWLVPTMIGALAYLWASDQAASQSAPVELQPVAPDPWAATLAPSDPLPWHVAAAMVAPLAYSYGELREMVSILDHRGLHDDADRLALVVLSMIPYQRQLAGAVPQSAQWFRPDAGRFEIGIPPYPPPPLSPLW